MCTFSPDGSEGYLLMEMAGVELRSHLSHLEQLMLALLPRYSRLDRYTLSPSLGHASHSHTVAHDTQRKLTLEVLCNVTTFGRSVIACSAKTAALTRILFAPHLGDGIPSEGRE